MKADLVIKNARVVDFKDDFRGGIAVKDGQIVAAGVSDMLPDARRVIDAEGGC